MNTHDECDDDKERQNYWQGQNAEDYIQDSLDSPSINSRGTTHLSRSQSPVCSKPLKQVHKLLALPPAIEVLFYKQSTAPAHLFSL